ERRQRPAHPGLPACPLPEFAGKGIARAAEPARALRLLRLHLVLPAGGPGEAAPPGGLPHQLIWGPEELQLPRRGVRRDGQGPPRGPRAPLPRRGAPERVGDPCSAMKGDRGGPRGTAPTENSPPPGSIPDAALETAGHRVVAAGVGSSALGMGRAVEAGLV